MAKAPYYIIFTLKDQILSSFLNVRVVVNNRDIYPLESNDPVVIALERDNPSVVITDGFHFTKPLKLTFKKPGYFNFNIVCCISNAQLIGGGIALVFFYLLGFLTGLLALKIISFLPILLLLGYYYFNRKSFLLVRRNKD